MLFFFSVDLVLLRSSQDFYFGKCQMIFEYVEFLFEKKLSGCFLMGVIFVEFVLKL